MAKSQYEELLAKIQRGRKKLDGEMSKEIAKIYRDAFINSYGDLEALLVRQEEGEDINKFLIAAKVEYTRQLYNEIEPVLNKYMELQCEDYINAEMDFYDGVLPKFRKDELFRAMKDKANITNRRIVDIMHKGGIYKDNVGLSDRLWFAMDASGNKLQDAIMSCLAQGKSAAEMAKAIEKFGKGAHKYWSHDDIEWHLGPIYAQKHRGGLDYAALRLARTTLTHMHQLQVIKSNEYNPYMNKVKWHSVHAAGRTCEQCIERDGKIFTRTQAPFDHPNGMCYLEAVFTDEKGNVLTPEQVAADIGKWIKGEKNSGLMDKIPEYKDLPVPKQKAKPQPKPKAQPKPKSNPGDEKLKEQLQAYNNHFADKVSKKEHKEYFNDVTAVLGNKYPKVIQDAYLHIFKGVNQLTQANGGAYWQAATRKVQFNIRRVLEDCERTGRGIFDTWFHETGHAMDFLLANEVNIKEGKYRGKVMSAQKPFINALKKDFENQKMMLRKRYLIEKGYDISNKTDDQIKKMLPDNQLNGLYNYYLRDNNKTAGIQDVVEGMSNCAIHVRWGHGKEYWNRSNREEEYASEAWANILGSYSDEETYEYMKEYFPNAMRMQQTIIQQYLKKVSK